MKKFWFIGLLLLLVGCEEANDIFGWEEYSYYDEIIVNEDGVERYYQGPVYINATSWGSIAYVSEPYVNKGVELLISETDDAEGGKVIEVNSTKIPISDLNANTQYYYCLHIPKSGIKSRILNMVVPDVSSLSMKLELVEDSLFCLIEDSISSSFIQEKGFRVWSDKYVVTGEKFAVSIPQLKKDLGFEGNSFGFDCYAYVQTANAYYRSASKNFNWEGSSSSDSEKEEDVDTLRINTEDITISEITEETIGNVDYLKCTVTGYVDNAYFGVGYDYEYYGNILYPDSIVTDDEGTKTTYYLKQSAYSNISLKAFYKLYYNAELGYYHDRDKRSSSYTPTNYNIRSLDDFLAFASFEGDSYYDEAENQYYTTLTLHEDITLPSDLRLSLNWRRLTVEGNGHTIDGISYFPLFRTISDVTIKKLKFGTDETVYDAKKGTSSFSTTSSETPGFLLSESTCYIYYHYPSCFDNCEIRGIIRVSGRDDFYVTKDYYYDWSEEDQATGPFEDYVVRIPGLKDYTKTEFK